MFQIDRILTLFVAGMALLMFVLSTIIAGINRKRLFSALTLSIVYSLFAAYYLYLGFLFKAPVSIMETEVIKPENPITNIFPEAPAEEVKTPDFLVVIQMGNDTFDVAPDDEIDIKKNGRFQIKEVKYPQGDGSEDIRADLKGFAGNARFNDGQDIGYWITYKDMMQHWSIEGEKDKFEIVVKNRKEPMGSIYVRFVD